MANNYFQFKKFNVQQDRCAMKVCTDACIFGAAVADQAGKKNGVSQALDIGAGTGLLSLMLAQKSTASIDAVEIDEEAAQQAEDNFSNSPWSNRLTVFKTDVLQFNPGKKYDFILSNPPFFEDDLQSLDDAKNAAKHDTALTLTQVLAMTDNHLSANGLFAVLLPSRRSDFFIEKATAAGFFLYRQILIRHSTIHPFFRSILFFSRTRENFVSTELSIRDAEGNYTADFIHLLKDYYLYL